MRKQPTLFQTTVVDKRRNVHTLTAEYHGKNQGSTVLVNGKAPEDKKKAAAIIAEQFPQLVKR